MLTQTIISVSLFLILMLECARLYLGVQGNLKEKVREFIFFFFELKLPLSQGNIQDFPQNIPIIIRQISNMFILWLYKDSRFGRILDVFVDPPITTTVGILISEYHARWNSRSRHNVPFTLVATCFRVRGPTWHGETSQTPFPHIAILLHPAHQNRMKKHLNYCSYL